MENPDDVLFLKNYDNDQVGLNPERIYYGNYIGTTYGFNESLYAKKENNFIYSSLTLENAKVKAARIDPSKVIIVYNLAGEVVNPGIELNEDLELKTTSNALFDSEGTILDNIYRTLIIKK